MGQARHPAQAEVAGHRSALSKHAARSAAAHTEANGRLGSPDALLRPKARLPMAGMSERADVIRRLAASLYETLLLAALALVVGFALLPVLTAGPSLPALEHALPLLTPAAQALSFGCLFAA